MNDIAEFFSSLFSPDSWPARWHCGRWTGFHGWLYIISSFLIALAYFSIPLILYYLIRKTRNKLPFQKIFWLFLFFILACGFTHVFDALMFWYPVYRVSAIVLFITAMVSCAAVVGLYRVIPSALTLKSPAALELIINERTNELGKANEFLVKTNLQLKESQYITEKLMKQKDDFLSIASHELKTPITSLKAYTQMLLVQSSVEENNKKDMLSKMDAQINKLTALINDLLDTTKLQEGGLVYNKKELRLDIMLKELTEEIQRTTQHTLIMQNTEPLTITADEERIGQVINNILSNAIKYSPVAGKISITLTRQNNQAVCCIQDFGFGIPEDQQPHVFKKFYRVGGEQLSTYPGLGLGLYISHEIIVRHNGKLWLESELGKGSSFYFSLPVSA